MKVSVNKGRIWNFVVFNHYFTTINTNNITISCQMYSLMLLYKKITFNCLFSMRIYQFSLFVKSDTTFGYSLERGSAHIYDLCLLAHSIPYNIPIKKNQIFYLSYGISECFEK